MISISNTKHWLIEQSGKFGNNCFILTQNRQITYAEFLTSTLRTVDYFRSKGISIGHHAGILSKNNIEFIVTVNALWFIGAVPVPLNTRNNVDEIENQLKHVDAKFLLIKKSLSEKFSRLNFDKKIVINTIETTDVEYQPSTLNSKHSTFYTFTRPWRASSALVLFTSGSSGKPKAVVHTFKSLYESVLLTDSISGLSANDTWLASLPFYHIGGFMIVVRSLLSGSSIVLPISQNYKDIITAIKKYDPSHISLVSTTLKQMLDDNIEPNKNLKQVYLGGGPLDSSLCENASNKGYPIVKVYGSTETCSMIAALPVNKFQLKPDSVGKPLGDTEIKIIDDEGYHTSSNQPGEIAVKCKSLAKEYFNDKSETEKKFVNGYYFTGDYGRLDEDEYLYIESRREDIIISGGENISRNEIENIIRSNPLIDDVYVFGIKDDTWGQKLCAVIVSKKLKMEEIKLFLRKNLPGYKLPKEIFLLDSIPRNEMGKVNRRYLFEKLSLNEF